MRIFKVISIIVLTVIGGAVFIFSSSRGEAPRTYEQAQMLEMAKRYREAVKTYRYITQEYPHHPLADKSLYRIAQIYYLDLDENREAIYTLGQLIKLYPRSELASQAQFEIAEIYALKLQSEEQALVNYSRYIELFPHSPRAPLAQYRIALGHFKLYRYAQAIIEADHLRARYPTSDLGDKALLLKARSLYIEGRPEDSNKTYQELITNYPTSSLLPEARFGLANSLEDQGRLNEALEIYRDLEGEYPQVGSLKVRREGLEHRLAAGYLSR